MPVLTHEIMDELWTACGADGYEPSWNGLDRWFDTEGPSCVIGHELSPEALSYFHSTWTDWFNEGSND